MNQGQNLSHKNSKNNLKTSKRLRLHQFCPLTTVELNLKSITEIPLEILQTIKVVFVSQLPIAFRGVEGGEAVHVFG